MWIAKGPVILLVSFLTQSWIVLWLKGDMRFWYYQDLFFDWRWHLVYWGFGVLFLASLSLRDWAVAQSTRKKLANPLR